MKFAVFDFDLKEIVMRCICRGTVPVNMREILNFVMLGYIIGKRKNLNYDRVDKMLEMNFL